MSLNGLCPSCQAFDIQCFSRQSFPWRGRPAIEIHEAANSGCPFCNLLVKSIKAVRGTDFATRDGRPRGWIHLTVKREGSHQDALNIIQMDAYYDESDDVVGFLQGMNTVTVVATFHVAADTGTPASISRDIMGTFMEKVTSSSNYMQAINKWLRECDNHPRCSTNMSGTKVFDSLRAPLPKRCIRVDNADAEGNVSICLEETKGRTGAYITISHRWIESETRGCATSVHNYSERLSGANFDNLPRLFCDVFYLAAQLGIPYVWIDSLCIIQDSVEDWRTESMNMGDYYYQARFTVTAPLSDGQPTNGLFSNGNGGSPAVPQLAQLPYRDKSGHQRGHFYVFPFDYGLHRAYRQQVSQSELLNRGWVFQEWIMSRRILCYTRSMVFMQCQRDLPRTELGETVESLDQFVTDASTELSLKASWTFENPSTEKLQLGWERIVEAYSRTKFTKPEEDRVIALSGIAQELQASMSTLPAQSGILEYRNRFVAGLWLWCIESGLLWRQTSRGVHSRLSTFPTWSWAAIYTQILWDHYPRTPKLSPRVECQVQKVTVMPSNQVHLLDPIIQDTNPVTTTEQQRTRSGNPPASDDDANSRARTRGNFAVLHVSGKLQPVFICGYFKTKEDMKLMADVTGQDQELGREAWRTVALPGSKGTVSGWASVEHPEFQDDASFLSTGPPIYALLVRTERGLVDGAIAFGHIIPWHSAWSVLFLRSVDRILNGYERIGMGRLCGPEPEKGFQMATERDIRLI